MRHYIESSNLRTKKKSLTEHECRWGSIVATWIWEANTMQKETMPAVLETTTFGELPEEPKTNALPLRQGTYWLLDEIEIFFK
jgi:hypothetical protein